MGAIAEQLADRVILTSDNPRTEDPLAILRDIQQGLTGAPGVCVVVEPDRRQAIHHALQTAQPGELILLAGKGHEEYQIIGTTKYPFSDREVVLEFFKTTQQGAKR
jgi:UDP-N-acetylmuramoyl-L-alanyl-D-glutamate--2,6-diaminopimelate ligase